MTLFSKPLTISDAARRLVRSFPGLFVAGAALRIIVFVVIFQATALVTRAFFDALAGADVLGLSAVAWAVLILVFGLLRKGFITADMFVFKVWRASGMALLRTNLFCHVLAQPGAQALPDSAGEAVSRFRGDPPQVTRLLDLSLFLLARLIYMATAAVIMWRIDPWLTAVVFLPLVPVVTFAQLARSRFERYRAAARRATGQVTGFIAEMLGAVEAVKVATAETPMLAQLQRLNGARKESALRDRLFSELIKALFRNTTDVGTGIILLAAAQALRDGGLSVGDFSLFVFYLDAMSSFGATIGAFWAQVKQSDISLQRMVRLLRGAPSQTLAADTPVYLRGPLPQLPIVVKTAADRLETLTAVRLSYRYPDSENGIVKVHLRLRRGSFTVVTGRIGCGKTTLLRVLLGLLPLHGGEIRWNGRRVVDPAAFFVPPRAAYVAQTPLLFSASLRENILLGLPETEVDLWGAVETAVLERDVAQLERGLDTLVGPRGVRLSGGQQQRAAAARAFVRNAELLVCDDLSSALDVDTERQLWRNLTNRSRRSALTCLVASHRRAVLRRADHIIVLRQGRVADAGTLAELLGRCDEMQRLWQEEAG